MPATGAVGVTYYRDVLPVFQDHCMSCHREGEIAPFALTTYDDAAGWAGMIREVVVGRRMPPWHADPAHGRFSNDRSLSQRELDTIVRWVDAGAPAGDQKDSPPPRTYPAGWQIGEPDAVFEMPQAIDVPAEGTIPYQYATVPTNFAEDRWVRAFEVHAGAREVVHHILVFLVEGDDVRRALRRVRGGASGYFAVLVPGGRPTVYPEGMGKRLPAGATLIFQIHYTATGKPQRDRSSIGFVFAKEPPLHEVQTRSAFQDRWLVIPPRTADHRVSARYVFRRPARLLSFLPHMHLRGKSFEYRLHSPRTGRTEVLLSVPTYDFGWQSPYYLARPIAVPAGAILECVATFDNSPANPSLTRDMWTKTVRWGPQTWEEMLIGYFDMIPEG